MSDESTKTENEDGFADALSAVAIVVLPAMAIVYWLSGMPSS
jgi:hypothetical protein